ncbi:MAG: glutamate 5-kinase [Quinella sp. 3Q1]|nr:glutamate 5-kinase [Quinella sp. 3Q1]MBR6888367.1 glutamate 5-kinase [Selenomonadaceae bacterium]
MSTARESLKSARRIVIKVGTSTLAHADTGKLNLYRIEHLIREIADLHNAGKEIIFVSSGAIAAGMNKLGIKIKPQTIPENQALAAVGQGVLMHIYEKFFAEYGQTIGQILLTKENAGDEHARENSRNSFQAILAMGAIPVVNENDAVGVDEIRIGDNDNLSAIVAAMLDAEVLIILSDIDGLYDKNPNVDKSARLIDEVTEINSEIERIAGGAGTKLGIGGMFTKIQAAKIATAHGVTMLIINGATSGNLRRALSGEVIGTIFPRRESS